MTRISLSGSKEFFTGEYADPSTRTYITYPCVYSKEEFYLVEPETFQAGGCTRTVQYRNKETGEIKAAENRSEGICLSCAKEIMKRHLFFQEPI